MYEFDDFHIDVDHLTLLRQSTELDLAPKAVEVLISLIERQGEILSKDEILETVWPDTVVEESNLFAYFSHLRKALGDRPDGGAYIETLKRRGYRFSGSVAVTVSAPGSGNVGSARTRSEDKSLAFATPDIGARHQHDPANKLSFVSRPVLVTMILLLAASAFLAFVYPFFSPTRKLDTIAVMPFVNDTDRTELDYLTDGMTDELISRLRNVPGLSVRSSTSVFRYKNEDESVETIGRELDVPAVLFGKLVRSNEGDLELRVELVDSENGNRIWDATYKRPAGTFASVQPVIATDLVSNLEIEISGAGKRSLERSYTANTEAFTLVTRGQIQIRKLTRQSIRLGIVSFNRAIELDPTYAPAWAGLSDAYRCLGMAGEGRPAEMFKQARSAAEKAIALDDGLSAGHVALGFVLFFFDWNWPKAEEEMLKAIELDPKSGAAYHAYAQLLQAMTRRKEANAALSRAAELEPFDPFINSFAASARLAFDPEDAERKIRSTIALEPDYYFSHMLASAIFMARGLNEESYAEYRKTKELNPDESWTDAHEIDRLVKAGKEQEAQQILGAILRRSEREWVPPFCLAVAYAGLGQNEKVLRSLEESYKVGDPRMTFLKMYAITRFRAVKDDPRYQDLLRRMNF